MKKIAVIPIDNRPICYTLIADILAQNKDIKLYLPERKLLGGLTSQADIRGLYEFIKNLPEVDCLIVALDTIAYGGLVSSRRCPETYEQIKENLLLFKDIIKEKAKKVFAFSSIMRISNNNVNEEEKEYWAQWGRRIFEFSYYQHKSRKNKSYNCVYNQIPENILNDYLDTRKRNFDINKLYLDWLEDKSLDILVFSKDDTGEYGLNVEEAQILEAQANERSLNALIKTGADEIPLSLIARALCENEDIKIKPVYIEAQSTDLISKYEDISVKNCVESQINLAGCKISQEPDLEIIVNNFQSEQGDLVLGSVINALSRPFRSPDKSYFIADINNANGSDDGLVYQMLNEGLSENLYGYAGYNTSANTIGCAILSAVTKFLAKRHGTYNDGAFKKLLTIRLLDDWAYQAHIRKYVREGAPDFSSALNNKIEEMKIFEEKIANFTNARYNEIQYSLPWKRSFEVEVNVKSL